jgi:signal transduction histidine kinase/ligand-binding sensor domain-containing protein
MARALGFLSCLLAVGPAWGLDPYRRISQYGHTAWRGLDGFVNQPTAIAQSTDGYLWVGTRTGLMRFDGVRFTRWVSPRGEVLPGRSLGALLGAADGSLWIGTSGGLSRLKDGALTNYMQQPTGAGVGVILEGPAGTIWVTRYFITDGKGPLCQVTGHDVQCFGKAEGLAAPYGLGLAQDDAGNFWIGSKALYRWTPGSSTVYFAEQLKHTGGEGVIDVATGPGGSVWATLDGIGPELGVRQYANGKWTSYRVPGFDGATVRSHTLFMDRAGALWIGSESQGLYRVHDGIADHYGPSDGLSGKSVNHIFEDREGNLWISTDAGLDMFRDTPVVTISTNQGLSASTIRSVLALRNGSVWAGNEGAVDVLEGLRVSSIATGRGLPGQDVGAMLEDHSGRVWLGVDDRVMTYQDGKFHEAKKPDGSPLGHAGVTTAISEDPAGNVWVLVSASGKRRLLRFEDQRLAQDVGMEGPFRRARYLATDGKPGVWISSATDKLARYRDGKMEIVSLGDGDKAFATFGLFGDSDGAVWAATSNGLYRWKDGRLNALDSRNGLPCPAIFAAIKDDGGSLWLYAECGLVKIPAADVATWLERPESKVTVKAFDALDGVLTGLGDVSQPRASKSPDGRLWFANGAVVHMVDPRRSYTNPHPPSVHVEELVADRKSYRPEGRLSIPPLRRELQIAYTALSFTVPRKVSFRYKLDGHDADWQEVGARREAFYNDLRPGDYRFRVIASNNDGVWNEAGAMLDFSIAPTWYQTAWFRVLCVASAFGIVWLLYDLRVRQIKRSQEAAEHARAALADLSKVASLGEMAAAIAHEVNQPLAAIGLNAAACQRFLRPEQLNVEEAQGAAGRIARDVGRANEVVKRLRELFGNSGGTKAPVDLNEAIHEVVSLTRSQVQKNGAVVRTDLSDGIPPVMGDRVQLQQVMVNLLVNAAEAMKDVQDRPRDILVRTLRETGRVRIEVQDTGIGVAPEQRERIFKPFHTTKPGGMGMGLSISKTIVEKHGGQLCVVKNDGPGSTFQFSIPVSGSS